MAARRKRIKGLQFDRSAESWMIKQYSQDSDNPERRRKWKEERALQAKVADNGDFSKEKSIEFLKELRDRLGWDGLAEGLGVSVETLKSHIYRPNPSLVFKATRLYKRLQGAKKAINRKVAMDAVLHPKPLDPRGKTKNHWDVTIKGPMSTEGLADSIRDFCSTVAGKPFYCDMVVAEMIVSLELQELVGQDFPPASVGYWHRLHEGELLIRSGVPEMGFEPFEMSDNATEIAQALLASGNLADIEIHLYARRSWE